MHDIRQIRDNPQAFDEGLKRRGVEPLSAALLAVDDRRRAAIATAQAAQEKRNALSKEIGQAKAKKDEARAQTLMAEVAALKDAIPAGEAAEKAAIAELEKALAEIPNLPLPEVPDGIDEHGNVERHCFGEKPEARRAELRGVNKLKEHFELGEVLGQMSFEMAAKLSGARFVVLSRQLARALTRARAVHARHPHQRARLRGGQCAASGARRGDVRHGAAAEVRGGSVHGHADPHSAGAT